MDKHGTFGRTAAAALLSAMLVAGATAQERRLLTGHVPAQAAKATAIGRLPSTNCLNLAIGLPMRDPAALTTLLQEIYDPASPNFRHYLTPEQFTERFGPTEADYQAVIAFAKAHGLAVTGTHPHRMLMDVAGSVAEIESAFRTTLRTYQHPTEPRVFYAPEVEPSIEAGVPVLDISGLSNFRVPHPKKRKGTPVTRANTPKPKATGSWPGGQFIGSDFRAAYVPGVALTGAGQVVGLLEFDGHYAADITQYESLAGLPNVPLQNVLLDGFNGVPTPGANSGNGEVALDIEMVISMAPGLSEVVVYEAGPSGLPNDVLSAMSANTAIKQFSCSWDFGTTPRGTMDGLFQKLAAQGQSFFNAAGDGGAFTGAWPEPDDDPYITLVGGTTLATCAPGGAWLSETAWNAPDLFQATAGGYTVNYSIAAYAPWQQGINMSANQGSTTLRNIPDVAMVADDIFIVADNGQSETTGGTSAAAPLWAAFAALANQQAAASGQAPIGFINPAIYALGKSGSYSALLNDVTAGNNSPDGTAPEFFAVPGYDLCTGWGSPAGGSLILALATPDRLVITPGMGFAANGPVGGPFSVTAQDLSLTNAGTSTLNWSLSNTCLWLNASPAGGSLVPSGAAATIAVSLNPAANNLTAGVYTANLQLTNTTSGLAQTRQFTVLVGQELVQDGGFEAGDFAYWNLSGPFAADNNFVDDGTAYAPPTIPPYAGNYFADLGATNSLDYLPQVLPTRTGQPYLLSFWWESVDFGNGTVPNEFLVKWGASTLMDALNVGVFDWTQQQFVVQGAGTNTVLEFGFRDDPSILGLDAVSVTPIPLPSFQSAVRANGAINLTWNTMAGLPYQLQYTTNVASANWINLGSPTNATSGTISASDAISPGAIRFYRVALVP